MTISENLIAEMENLKNLKEREMERRYNELTIFADLCNNLLKTLNIEAVSTLFIDQVRKLISSKKCILVRKNVIPETYIEYEYNESGVSRKELRRDALGKNCLIMFCKTPYCFKENGGFIGVPIKYEGENVGVIILEGLAEIDKMSAFTAFLRMLTIPLGIAFKNCIFSEQLNLEKNVIERQGHLMERELILAQKVQNSFLPQNAMSFGHYRIYSTYIPSKYLSGDIFDSFYVQNNKMLIYIADVSGHGVASAMLTGFLKYSMHLISRRYFKEAEQSPAAILKILYKKYFDLKLDTELYITMFMGILNTETNVLTYANAGHNIEPLLLDNDMISPLICRGFPLFCVVPPEDVEYQEKQVSINRDAELYLLTDGLVEASDAKGNFYGMERVKDMIRNRSLGFDDKVSALISSARSFTGETDFEDDIAILCLKRGG